MTNRDPGPPALPELLEHQDFVRRLARHLVGDEHRAEDLAQEVWVAALRRAPSGLQSIRAWLARVTRNLAANAAVGDRHRRERETLRAREGSVSEEARHEFELTRSVAAAVHALDEPYRTTILLRYFKELSRGQIAAEMGAPVATMSTRLQRGATRTDAEGRFEFEVVAGSTYLVHTARGGGVVSSSKPFVISAGEHRRVDLELPAPGRLTGRVVSAQGPLPRDLRLWARAESLSHASEGGMPRALDSDAVLLGADGSFDTGPLAPGPVTVFLLLPERTITEWSYSAGHVGRPGGSLLLGRVEVPDGETVQHDFNLDADLPGTVRIRARCRGELLIGAGARVGFGDEAAFTGVTDAAEKLDPIPAFPGELDLRITEPTGIMEEQRAGNTWPRWASQRA